MIIINRLIIGVSVVEIRPGPSLEMKKKGPFSGAIILSKKNTSVVTVFYLYVYIFVFLFYGSVSKPLLAPNINDRLSKQKDNCLCLCASVHLHADPYTWTEIWDPLLGRTDLLFSQWLSDSIRGYVPDR